jgi:hypothetical protein
MQRSRKPFAHFFVGTPIPGNATIVLHSILVAHRSTVRAVRRQAITPTSIGREGKLKLRLRWSRRAWSPCAGHSGSRLLILIGIVLELGQIGMKI